MHESSQILILNPGSSTIKGAVFACKQENLQRLFYFNEKLTPTTNFSELIFSKIKPFNISCIAVRVVHALKNYQQPILWNKKLEEDIVAAKAIAPIHNDLLLKIIKCIHDTELKTIPLYACFDSSFYYELPVLAKKIPISKALNENGINEKMGFHGFAHQSMIRQYFNQTKNTKSDIKVLSLQLGSGCSITASISGRPVETSMGFTPLEGLMMASRCGSIDPGLILYWLKQGKSEAEIEKQLNYFSGLLSLTNSNDFKKVISENSEDNNFAIDLFCQSILKYIGGYLVLMGGVDAIIFGGGVGENSPKIRSKIIEKLNFLNIYLDEELNHSDQKTPLKINNSTSKSDIFVIQPDEEFEMVHEVSQLIKM